MMAAPFKVTTNIASMNAQDKRAHIFNHLIQEGHDIIALQETHCTNNNIKSWQDKWQGKSVWNAHSSKSAGVAFLFHPKLNVEILNFFCFSTLSIRACFFLHSFSAFCYPCLPFYNITLFRNAILFPQ